MATLRSKTPKKSPAPVMEEEVVVVESENDIAPMKEKGLPKFMVLVIGIVVGLLLVVIAYPVGIFVRQALVASNAELVTGVDDVDDVDEVDVVESKETFDENDEGDVVEVLEITGERHTISVDWLSMQEYQRVDMYAPMFEIYMESWDNALPAEQFSAWKIGTINGGKYDGWDLTYEVAALPGLGEYHQIAYLVRSPNAEQPAVVLDRYSAGINSFTNTAKNVSFRDMFGENKLAMIDGRMQIDTGAWILEFEQNNIVEDSNGNRYAYLGTKKLNPDFLLDAVGNKVGELSDLPALRLSDTKQTFVSQQADGRALIFDYIPPFWQKPGEMHSPVSMKLSDGSYKTIDFIKGNRGGCGYTTSMNLVSLDDIGEVKSIGRTTIGTPSETIYAPLNYNADTFQEAFKLWQISNKEGTFEEFTSGVPYFYWESPFGWIQFTNTNITPAVECGKPVIYLYPEETMDINVTVEPKGGFSITIPDYNDGWSVSASPSGKLVNKKDGAEYPYLFWEGNGGLYTAPKQNWVMEQEEVESFLYKTLYQLGLNKNESFDFMEFWYPRMQNAPYYKIGFHGTRVMDEIAPLSVSGNPETIIRVLMDYEELDALEKENPPNLPSRPVRDGFTVIEWGGVLVR